MDDEYVFCHGNYTPRCHPVVRAALMKEGLALLEQQHYLKAARCFMEIAEQNPLDIEAYIRLGWSFSHLGKAEYALDAFEFVTELEPGVRTLPLCVAFQLDGTGKRAEAVALLQELILRDQRYLPADRKLHRAALAYLEERLEDADLFLCSALEWQPENQALYSARALLLLERERPEEALEILNRLHEAGRATIPDHYHRALAAWRCEQLTLVCADCKYILSRAPGHFKAAWLLAVAHWQRGNVLVALYWMSYSGIVRLTNRSQEPKKGAATWLPL